MVTQRHGLDVAPNASDIFYLYERESWSARWNVEFAPALFQQNVSLLNRNVDDARGILSQSPSGASNAGKSEHFEGGMQMSEICKEDFVK